MKGEKPTLPWPAQTAPLDEPRDTYNNGRWPGNVDCPLLKVGGRFSRNKQGCNRARNKG